MDSKKVFINCPFDNHFFPLLKSLLFTLIYLDFEPQISETADCGQVRINRIKKLMKNSQYSIHDLSRMDALKKGELPRFNMPFECGMDFGFKLSGKKVMNKKKFLILEKKKYRYQKVISDISGNDIRSHKNNPENLIRATRDWFAINNTKADYAKEIWLAYNEFIFDYEGIIASKGCNPNDIFSLTFKDVIINMRTWIKNYKKRSKVPPTGGKRSVT
jgi:hypothetical protein